MKGLLFLGVLALGLACSRPAGQAPADADTNDSTSQMSAAPTGAGGLSVLRGTVRGVGPVALYLMPKSADSLGGTLIYPRPDGVESPNAYEVLKVAGKQRDQLLWLNLGSNFNARGDLRGTLSDSSFQGEWRDASGIPRHTVKLRYHQLPYGLITRSYNRVRKPNPLSLDIHVSWTEMVEPSPPEVRNAFNRSVYANAEKGWTSFEQQFEDEQRSLGNEELPEYARHRSFEQYDELLYADERLICYRQFAHFYMGGAHPMWGLQSQVFDVLAGRFLEPDDLFVDRRLPLHFLSDYCRMALSQLMNLPPDDGMMLGGTEAKRENFQQLLPTAQGLLVQFNPYEVGPYAAGAPEVLIPWRELQAQCRIIPALEAIARAAQPPADKP